MIFIFILLPMFSSISGFTKSNSTNFKRAMTVWIHPGAEECFHIPNIVVGKHLEIEYQVTYTSASTGNWDIHTRLLSPAKELTVLYSERSKEGMFDEEISGDEGDYKLCFSNYMSTWSEKYVWFEVTVKDAVDYDYDYHEDLEDIEDEDMDAMLERNSDEATKFEMSVEEIQGSLHRTRIFAGRIKHYQMMFNSEMSMDVHQGENNLAKVNLWSTVHLVLILIVGCSQVYLIRQLFEDKSMIHKVFQTKI